jgi:crotonobetainyl-CoA:carnitine CoA-transferase CaiB-like acyl-CoA transferase
MKSAQSKVLPLKGIRILDFTWGGAGPFATKVMADFGAEVVKIETNTHYDFPRTMGPYAGGIKGVNRSGYFTNRNSSKNSVTLNLKKKEALAVAAKLAATCDIAINNFRAGVLEKLGLGYQQLAELRPDIIYVSMPLQGSSGPQANYSGVGHTLNVLAGIYGLTGYQDGTLVGPGTNYPDHSVNPGHALVAIMCALIHRKRTGLGQYIEVSQLESTMNLLGPAIVAQSLSGTNPTMTGNTSATAAPYGVFECAGNEWIAISVGSDDEWTAFSKVAQSQPWAADDVYKTREGRLAKAEELDGRVRAWTRTENARALMNRLQGVGVRAGVVQTAKDLVERDEQIAMRGDFVTVDHAEMGPVVYNASPFILSKTPAQLRSAPLIGEHNDKVFGEWAGIPDGERARLKEAGIFD